MVRSLSLGVTLMALLGGAASAAPTQDLLVQPPTLSAPGRGSIAGSLSKISFGTATLGRGAATLPLPLEVPAARGPLLAALIPAYSPETGLTEWGLGWQAELSIRRYRVLGELDFQSDDFTSPWGKLTRGDDGHYYPTGLSALVRLSPIEGGWQALTGDGTTYRFEAADAVLAPAGTLAWMLSRVDTLLGDSTTLTWTRNASGRPFLEAAQWGGRGDGAQYRLAFTYSTLATPLTTYVSGVRQILDRRVQRVTVNVRQGASYATRWRYDLTYRAGNGSPAYYLAAIQKTYSSGQADPPQTYDYDLNAEHLSTVRLTHSPALDALIAANGNRVLQPDRAALTDLERDGLPDLESYYDFSAFRQSPSGFTVEPLPVAPGASPLCRPPASLFNKPRVLARMDGTLGEPHVVVARKLGFGGTTQLLVCDRLGIPLSDQTVLNNWELSATSRLVDVDRDRRPDLVRVSAGRLSVLRNTLSPTQFVTWVAGPETLLSPAISPLAMWMHDLNGDGNADAIVRHTNGIALWYGLGAGRFETTGRAAVFRLANGAPLAGVTEYELGFGDYNGDGVADLTLSKGQTVGVFLNGGTAFVQATVPGLTNLPFTIGYPVIADLAQTGEETVMMTDGARALALPLTRPGTGFLRAVDDGKGTVVRFSYQRAAAAPWQVSRASVLAAVTVESSGYDPVTHTYAYGPPVIHSLGQQLVGYAWAERRAPAQRERVQFHHDDDVSSLAVASEQRDERTPDLLQFFSAQHDERAFHGVRWLRPRQQVRGLRNEAATIELAETTQFVSYQREHCPTVVLHHGADSDRTETNELASVAPLPDELHCQTRAQDMIGAHHTAALNFSHRVEVERNALGLITKVTQLAEGLAPLVLQEIAYDSLYRPVSVHVPGRGTSEASYDALGRLTAVTDPLGVVMEAVGFDPLTETMAELRTHRPDAELSVFFQYDGKERLAASWNNMVGSATTPLEALSYQEASAVTPGRIESTRLLDATAGVTRRELALLAADGGALAAGVWHGDTIALGTTSVVERATLTQRSAYLGRLSATELATLTSSQLRARGTLLHEQVRSGFGPPISTTTVQQQGVTGEVTSEQLLSATELVTRVQSPGGHLSETAIDALGRVVRKTDALGVSHHYAYDALGRLVEVVTPDGVHRLELDAHGRPARIWREGLGSVEYSYDGGTGALATKRVLDAEGALVRELFLDYDSVGRITQQLEQAAGTERALTLEYDGALAGVAPLLGQLGHRSRVASDGWQHTTEVDALGRPRRERWVLQGWRAVQVEREFFADGAVASERRTVTSSDGSVLHDSTQRVQLDEFGRPASIVLDGQSLYTLSYDDEGRIARADFASGEELTFDYDPVTRRRRGYAVASPASTGSTQWQLDERGQIASERYQRGDHQLERVYAYDGRGALVQASDELAQSSYTYSASGHPQSVSDVLGARDVRRAERTLWVGDTLYTWDAAGRVVGKGPWSFQYGASGQLETAQRAGRTVTYVYDDTGARLLKKVDGVPVRAEVAGGVLTEQHFYELVVIGGVVAGVLDNGQFTALLADPRGTPLATLDGADHRATPYGVRQSRTALAEVLDFARLGWDADLEVVRMGVRDYDPALSQFWTPDPLYLESLEHCARSPIDCNLYGYAKGDPLSWTDSSGTDPKRVNSVVMYQTCDSCGSLARSASIERSYTSIGLQNGKFQIGYLGQDNKRYTYAVPMANLGGAGAGTLIQLPGNVLVPRLWNKVSAPEVSEAMAEIAGIYASQADGALAAMHGFDFVLNMASAADLARGVFKWSLSRTSQEMTTVYRGISGGTEVRLFEETGEVLSDAARQAFMETGSMSEAVARSQAAHDEYLKIWGKLDDYVQAHGEWGGELAREFGVPRSMISVTTDLKVARSFAGDGGVVITARIPTCKLIPQTLKGSTESELLILHRAGGFK